MSLVISNCDSKSTLRDSLSKHSVLERDRIEVKILTIIFDLIEIVYIIKKGGK